MTAASNVILHPALVAQLLAEQHAEAEHCRERLHDIINGRILPEEIGPEFTGPSARADAIDAAQIALEWAEAELAELEGKHARGAAR